MKFLRDNIYMASNKKITFLVLQKYESSEYLMGTFTVLRGDISKIDPHGNTYGEVVINTKQNTLNVKHYPKEIYPEYYI